MSNDDPSSSAAVGGGGRTPRQGAGGSPVGSTLTIVLAVVALVAGFLILNNITDDGGSGSSAAPGVDEPVGTDAVTTTTQLVDINETTTTTTTLPPRVTDGATVVVANGNSIGGSAGRMSRTLETVGYTMGTPVNATVTVDDSIVYYDPGVAAAEAVAQSVARDMGCVDAEPAPTPPPTEDGTLGEGGVLVVLGNNQADKTIDEMALEGCGTEPVTGEAPAPSGSEDVVAPTSTEATGEE